MNKVVNGNISPRRGATGRAKASEGSIFAPKGRIRGLSRAASQGEKASLRQKASAQPRRTFRPLPALATILLTANLVLGLIILWPIMGAQSARDRVSLAAAPSLGAALAPKPSPTAATQSPSLNLASDRGQDSDRGQASGKAQAYDIDEPHGIYLVVNRRRPLSPDYAPGDLVNPDLPYAKDNPQMRQAAATALVRMHRAALADGVKFSLYSGYRDYAYQKRIWENSIKVKGLAWAKAYVAPPGCSEHQSGLACDLSSSEVGMLLDEAFADTKAGKWLSLHSWEYGFILRYKKGQEGVTGYAFEPWHFRYLGQELAKELYKSGASLEEYFGLLSVGDYFP